MTAESKPAYRPLRGYTLIELLVAMSIALFLLGGLLIITQNMRRSFGNQNQLAQLQDTERMAMSMITNVIQRAGYFPNPFGPGGNSASSVFPVEGHFATAGQSIAGITGDAIFVRYVTTGSDNLISCAGTTNPGAQTRWTNEFSIVNNQLVCTLSANGGAGTQYPIVNNVTSLQILYGVNRSGNGSNSIDSYVSAANMSAADWGNLISVQVTLTFLYTTGADTPEAGAAQTQTLTFTRVIDVMNVGGVAIS
jgi:type IV pilus assembly protein PilW